MIYTNKGWNMNLENIFQNVIKVNAADVQLGVQAAPDSGIFAEEILNKSLPHPDRCYRQQKPVLVPF